MLRGDMNACKKILELLRYQIDHAPKIASTKCYPALCLYVEAWWDIHKQQWAQAAEKLKDIGIYCGTVDIHGGIFLTVLVMTSFMVCMTMIGIWEDGKQITSNRTHYSQKMKQSSSENPAVDDILAAINSLRRYARIAFGTNKKNYAAFWCKQLLITCQKMIQAYKDKKPGTTKAYNTSVDEIMKSTRTKNLAVTLENMPMIKAFIYAIIGKITAKRAEKDHYLQTALDMFQSWGAECMVAWL
jgi:hypothetical protein